MSQPEPATTPLEVEQTGVGSVFVSNHPPFSFWNGDCLLQVDFLLPTFYDEPFVGGRYS